MMTEHALHPPLHPGDGEVERLINTSRYARFKAVAEVVAALALLAVAAPLLLLIMILVRLTSRGPALYSQVRLGRDGREYTIYKIRTMFHDCERVSGPRWSTRSDPRVTPLGSFLRISHLDELPQLWNVIRGEMSLIGPRPERPEFVRSLQHAIPEYRARLLVRPGITGLAQVQLPPDTKLADVRRKVACDLCYIRRMGPWLDLRILVGTALKVVGVPPRVTRRVLALPGVNVLPEFGPTPSAEEAVPQLQMS